MPTYASIEAALLRELRTLMKNPSISRKDLRDWAPYQIAGRYNERVVYLPKIQLWVAYQVQQ